MKKQLIYWSVFAVAFIIGNYLAFPYLASAQTLAPSFFAVRTADQTITTGVTTPIDWQSTNFNYGGNFDLTTDNFTPTVAGRYLLVGAARCQSGGETMARLIFGKNGASITNNSGSLFAANDARVQASIIVDANGTTDYFSMGVNCQTGTTLSANNLTTFFSASYLPTYSSASSLFGTTTLAVDYQNFDYFLLIAMLWLSLWFIIWFFRRKNV